MNYKQLLLEARAFAIKAHDNQKYGIYPYEIHLGNVVAVLMRFGIRPADQYNFNLLAAAWLHDVLEDSEITEEELKTRFGKDIAAIVYALSDDKGDTRAERKANFYNKISDNQDAIIVKLADRIANVEFSLIHGNSKKYETYKAEQVKLEENLLPLINTETGLELFSCLKKLFL